MRKLYKYEEDFRRMGDLDSVFIADEEDVEEMLGNDIYLGEVLGKHSEVIATVDDSTLTMLSDNQEVIKVLDGIFPDGHIGGIDILGHYQDRKDCGDYGDVDEDDD